MDWPTVTIDELCERERHKAARLRGTACSRIALFELFCGMLDPAIDLVLSLGTFALDEELVIIEWKAEIPVRVKLHIQTSSQEPCAEGQLKSNVPRAIRR